MKYIEAATCKHYVFGFLKSLCLAFFCVAVNAEDVHVDVFWPAERAIVRNGQSVPLGIRIRGMLPDRPEQYLVHMKMSSVQVWSPALEEFEYVTGIFDDFFVSASIPSGLDSTTTVLLLPVIPEGVAGKTQTVYTVNITVQSTAVASPLFAGTVQHRTGTVSSTH